MDICQSDFEKVMAGQPLEKYAPTLRKRATIGVVEVDMDQG